MSNHYNISLKEKKKSKKTANLKRTVSLRSVQFRADIIICDITIYSLPDLLKVECGTKFNHLFQFYP